MVDVVFKKALKEFRLNIFNSYSTALAVCDVYFNLQYFLHNNSQTSSVNISIVRLHLLYLIIISKFQINSLLFL